jgi:hypothetical protein
VPLFPLRILDPKTQPTPSPSPELTPEHERDLASASKKKSINTVPRKKQFAGMLCDILPAGISVYKGLI